MKVGEDRCEPRRGEYVRRHVRERAAGERGDRPRALADEHSSWPGDRDHEHRRNRLPSAAPAANRLKPAWSRVHQAPHFELAICLQANTDERTLETGRGCQASQFVPIERTKTAQDEAVKALGCTAEGLKDSGSARAIRNVTGRPSSCSRLAW